MRKTLLTLLAAAAAALAVPAAADAASAIATGNVNLRAGPSTAYPVVDVVPAGDDVEIYGCLSDRAWCDVGYYGYRGWMSSNYLATVENRRRYTGPRVVEIVRAPTISFSIGGYWDRHYRDRPFYRDRRNYDAGFDRPRPPRGGGDWDGPRGGGYDGPRRGGDWDGPRRGGRDIGGYEGRMRDDFRRGVESRLRDIGEDVIDDRGPPRRRGGWDGYGGY